MSFGRCSSFGDEVFLGVPGDVLLGVRGDVFLGVPGMDLSPADLTRRLLGGRGEIGDLGERSFDVFLSFIASGEGILVRSFARVSASSASCLLGVVASGDLASPLLTAWGVTIDEGGVTLRVLVGVVGGGCGSGISLSLVFEFSTGV